MNLMPLFLMFLSALCYVLFGIFTGKTAGKLNPNLVAATTNAVATIVTLLFYFATQHRYNIEPTKEGVLFSAIAGVTISVLSIALVAVFSQVTNLSFVMPLVYGMTIILSAIIGFLLFKDSMSPMGLAGLVLVTIGIGLIVYSKLVK